MYKLYRHDENLENESVGHERKENDQRTRELNERTTEIRTIRTLETTAHLADVQHVKWRGVEHLHFKMLCGMCHFIIKKGGNESIGNARQSNAEAGLTWHV